jgi:hypothetical protein
MLLQYEWKPVRTPPGCTSPSGQTSDRIGREGVGHEGGLECSLVPTDVAAAAGRALGSGLFVKI